MFDWYYKNYLMENSVLFWIGVALTIILMLITVFLILKEAKRKKNGNK